MLDLTNIVSELRKKSNFNPLPTWGDREYTGWMDENMSWKTNCCLGDWSAGGKVGVLVEGPQALKLFQDLSVNSLQKLEGGRLRHLIMCADNGKCIINGLLFDRGDGSYYWQHHAEWPRYQMLKRNYDCHMSNTVFYDLQLAGPSSIYVLEKVLGQPIRDLAFMAFKPIRLCGHNALLIRQNMAGEIGYELEGPLEYKEEVIQTLMKAGKEYGIRRLGWRSVFMNHLESGTSQTDYVPAIYDPEMRDYLNWLDKEYGDIATHPFHISGSFESNDIRDWYRSPYEQGWGMFVKFNHDFIGRKALEKEAEHLSRTWRSLEWNSDDVLDVYASMLRQGPHYDYMEFPKPFEETVDTNQILKNDKLIGTATSRGYSYYFRKVISHAVIDMEYAEPGTQVEVLWGEPGHPQKRIRATVCPSPYKTDHRRDDVSVLPSYL